MKVDDLVATENVIREMLTVAYFNPKESKEFIKKVKNILSTHGITLDSLP
jgi:hypothetical protein